MAAAPFLPAPSVIQGLKFSSSAFVLAMKPLEFERLDVLYGFGSLSPSFACRVQDDYSLAMSDNYRAYLERDAAIQAARA